MRISDWSSDVCSSDLPDADLTRPRQGFVSPEPVESAFDYGYDAVMRGYEASRARLRRDRIDILYAHDLGRMTHGEAHPHHFCQIGRASCRERVCQYV